MPVQGAWSKMITNNGRFQLDDPEYRRVSILNIMLIALLGSMVYFAVVSVAFTNNRMVTSLTVLGALCTLGLIIYLHRTDRIHRASHLTVCLLFAVFGLYALVKGPNDYGFIYPLLFPMVAYTLVGVRTGDAYVAIFTGVMAPAILLSYHAWHSEVFSAGTLVNLAQAFFACVLLMRSFERNREMVAHWFLSLNHELRTTSTIDKLTGIKNRRVLEETLVAEMRRQQRYLEPLSVMMLDLDHFMQVNDLYGHLVGDKVLVHTAQLVLRTVRETDTVGRYGGEELLIILPNTNRQQLESVAARLVGAAQENSIPPAGTVTYSVGGTSFRPGDTAEDLIRRADKAMYTAKENGRNQAAFLWSDGPEDPHGPVPIGKTA